MVLLLGIPHFAPMATGAGRVAAVIAIGTESRPCAEARVAHGPAASRGGPRCELGAQ